MSSKKIIEALDILENERGIKREVVFEALKEALEKSYKKNYMCAEATVRVEINPKNFKISLFEIREVVDDVNDEDLEISLEEAREINPKFNIGDLVETVVSPDVFGRLAASQTKQILRQKIREAEKESLYQEYADKKDEIITGIIDRVEPRFAIINIGKMGALLPLGNQIPHEKLVEGQHIKVYVTDVENNPKGTHVNVSRTDPKLVKRLFELEVPEIYDGTVEIKSVSREAGERTKIAVYAKDENIDPIGACVGPKGTRVRNIVEELNGEMIDIVQYSNDPKVFISNALSPAVVLNVLIGDEKERTAIVVVPDNQLSLAIGKRGQNARLAVRLTDWKIDIKSLSEAIGEGIDLTDEVEENEIEMVVEDFVVEADEDEAVEMPSLDEVSDEELISKEFDRGVAEIEKYLEAQEAKEAAQKVNEEVQKTNEETQKSNAMPIYAEGEEYEYEYEDDDLSKYDEEIDYDAYDEYYDNN